MNSKSNGDSAKHPRVAHTLSSTGDATRQARDHHVTQMRANFLVKSMAPKAEDVALQQRYIDGAATLTDMLQHARDYVSTASALPR